MAVHPVVKAVLQRLALGVLTLFLVSVIIFTSVDFLPGSYANAVLGHSATPETVAAFEKELGLDRPAYIRYAGWVSDALRGNLGNSYAGGASSARSVAGMIGPRLYNTMFLAVLTALLAVPSSIVIGLLTALYRGTWFDRLLNGGALGVISFPEFFIAYLLTYVVVLRDSFAYTAIAHWMPQGVLGATEALFHLVPQFPVLAKVSSSTSLATRAWICALPALTLTMAIAAQMMRMTRASVIGILSSSYIEMAKLKGVPPGAIIVSHALPNAWAPIANVIAFNLAYLIVGVVVVEVVFVYPGIGQLMVDAVRSRDVPVVQACALIFAAAYIVFNLLADIVSVLTNPRLLHPR